VGFPQPNLDWGTLIEELGLYQREFQIVRELNQIQTRQFSIREQREKDYHFCVFAVELFPTLSLNREGPNYAIRWLSTGCKSIFASATEVEELKTVSGQPISATT
jgi:hypothetical protein